MADPRITDKFTYTIAHRDFYEDLSRYSPLLDDFHRPLRSILPPDWILSRRAIWWDCCPQGIQPPPQGWKIHISATPAHAPAILMTAARILFIHGVSFKFVADRMLLMLVCGKRWDRGAAGKFVTIYPASVELCSLLLEELHLALVGYWGPYILSDRRYKDSRTVYYRYGGFAPMKRTTPNGAAIHVIQGEGGAYIDDRRMPFFQLPRGIDDPFQSHSQPSNGNDSGRYLKNGRYRIEAALAHSSAGNVYLAQDQTLSRKVVIKEARPYMNVTVRGLDAVQLLKKEWRLLKVLETTQIAPAAIEFFFEWEHAFLVEEYLENCITLREYLSSAGLLLRTRPNAEFAAKYFARYRRLFCALAVAIQTLHDMNIVFSDLSLKNLLVARRDSDDDISIRLIDLEGAYEEGVDLPTPLFTPGFSPMEWSPNNTATKKDDCYGLGALMLSGIFPITAMLVLDRGMASRYLEACESDFGFPEQLVKTICRLLSPDPAERPVIQEVLAVLNENRDLSATTPCIGCNEFSNCDVSALLLGVTRYIKASADFSRHDRLFPADPAVFETNPLSLSHGACGVAYALHQAEVEGNMESRLVEWILSHEIRTEFYPPGLFSGLAGIAWTLLELGYDREAIDILDRSVDHHLLWRSPDLYHGAAGWGLAQLHFLQATKNDRFLANALRAGQFLLNSRQKSGADESVGTSVWSGEYGVSASLGHGVAGVSLFLQYLYLATGATEYLEAGQQGLDWVLREGFHNSDGGLTWKMSETVPSYTPYLRWGSSGIGRVILRYWHVTGEARYCEALERIIIDCDRKYTIYPGYFFGLAGICEMFFDMSGFARWACTSAACIKRLLSGCLLFRISRDAGVAFPGETLSRISCDLGTGSAGIALVLDRLNSQGKASFMADELIPGWNERSGHGSATPLPSADTGWRALGSVATTAS